ncbi:aldolase/citrate lyase family protein [Streptomyces calidiresistens]|uniref:Aldolase n=1 Tax=Streptomyces calidiresistens TaxID=1485586 RepID=A0A7W3T821_9ACTN|nr:aldolase/citrate lyase family protein [Streptomyces calidiresistens]MBB0232682.1 aldolase [Streptomyces calidiresistens]
MTGEAGSGSHPTSLDERVLREIERSQGPIDLDLARRLPGDPAGRQPVHTVYMPADTVPDDPAGEWGRAALESMDRHAPDPTVWEDLLGAGVDDPAALDAAVREKLRREPVEDLRIDFEDGYGIRPDAEEDARALAVGRLLARLVAEGTAPPFLGIRMKSLEAPDRRRGIRTLDIVLTALHTAGPLPPGLLITLPKVTHPARITAMAELCAALEETRGLPHGTLRFEAQIETTTAVFGTDGRVTPPLLIDAAGGRLVGLHHGTYDYTAACGVAAHHQAPDHPAAEHAKAVMQVAAAGTGVRVVDGSSNVLPVGDTSAVRAAWRTHARLVERSLARGFHQGWDLHPGQLPTRYAAVFAFFRRGLTRSAERLAARTGRVETGVLEEPATARALADHLLRGVDCGAVPGAEVEAACGIPLRELAELAGRPTPP